MNQIRDNSESYINSDARALADDMRQSWRIEMGERIQAAAKMVGSQQKAADAAGVSLSTLQRYFRGEVDPSVEGIKRLAEEAGVSVGWLISGEGEPRSKAPETPVNSCSDGRHGLLDAQAARVTPHVEREYIARVWSEGARVLALAQDEGVELERETFADIVRVSLAIKEDPQHEELVTRMIRHIARKP